MRDDQDDQVDRGLRALGAAGVPPAVLIAAACEAAASAYGCRRGPRGNPLAKPWADALSRDEADILAVVQDLEDDAARLCRRPVSVADAARELDLDDNVVWLAGALRELRERGFVLTYADTGRYGLALTDKGRAAVWAGVPEIRHNTLFPTASGLEALRAGAVRHDGRAPGVPRYRPAAAGGETVR